MSTLTETGLFLRGAATLVASWEEYARGASAATVEVDSSTRAMAVRLDDIRSPRPQIELGRADWCEHLRIAGVPPNLLDLADPRAYHILIARLEGEEVATAMAFDHAGDCGIYNTGTLAHARRRGLATALTALHLHDARTRGCETASLQSTHLAERLYASVGFNDLGRILEYVPTNRRWPGGPHSADRRGCHIVGCCDGSLKACYSVGPSPT